MVLIIVLAILVLLILVGVGMYNGLVKSKIRVDEAWSDITVQLKRRVDLIPNLVNTVKGYATHEKEVFEQVTEARAGLMSAQGKGVAETAKAENQFESTLKTLFAVAENYPELKANENFKELQAELVDTEDKIQASRRFYNGSVRDYNTKTKTFPTVIFANMMGFKPREFFELEGAEEAAAQKPVEVKF